MGLASKSANLNMSSAIYNHLNQNSNSFLIWEGWHKLWRLRVAPRVKHFVWMLLHGRISTTDYLNSINLGPRSLCSMCSLDLESIEHLFIDCCKAQLVWNLASQALGRNLSFPDNISSGAWITDYNLSLHSVSFIAAILWFIWKSRCEAIFKSSSPNFTNIVRKAEAHVKAFWQENASGVGRRLILNNFSNLDECFLFYAHNWNCSNKVGHLGFFVSNLTYSISCAGNCKFVAESQLDSEIRALDTALRTVLDRQLSVRRILHCSRSLPHLLNSVSSPMTWRYSHPVSDVNHLLLLAGDPSFVEIPGRWNAPAFALSVAGANLHNLNLFLSGRDLPRWIMKLLLDHGFTF